MLKNDTLKNGTSCIGLYGSAPPGPADKTKKKHLFGINDIAGARLLTRLRVDFSDLRQHKFHHRFNCDSPTCTCGRGLESVEHFFLHCQFYADQRRVLIDSVSEVIGNEVQVYPEQHLCCIFLYGSESFNWCC